MAKESTAAKAKMPTPAPIEEQTAPKGEQSGDNFFSTTQKDREGELNDFLKHMKMPREQVDEPGFSYPDDDEPDEPEKGDTPDNPKDEGGGETDEQMLDHFDYTPEHKYTAEFLLIQLDKIIAFGLGMFSGLDSDRYRRRKARVKGDDYEAEVLAALLKKYQMRLSLEWMFVSAIVIAYAPAVEMAVKDRAVIREKQAREKRREEIETIAQTVKNAA